MGINRFPRRDLIFIALTIGFSSGIIQVLLVREILTLCRGNELIIGMLFASWFLGVYLGARTGPGTGHEALARRVSISLVMLPVMAAGSIYLAHYMLVFIPRPVGGFYSFTVEVLLAFFLTIPVSFFIGFFFPSLVALVAAGTDSSSGGTVFFLESLGSFLGGVVFSFVLVKFANPLAITAFLVIPGLAVIAIRNKPVLLPLAVVPLAVIFFSGVLELAMFEYAWNKSHTGRLIEYRRTKYQFVAVESNGDSVSIYGNGSLMYTLPDRYEARGIFHLVQSLRQDRRSLLVMGSGPGSLLQNLLRSGADIQYVEPDPELWELMHAHVERLYPKPDGKRPSVASQDPRYFLKNSAAQFDMIVSVPPRPENIMLNRFYTQEFYSLCKRHLRSDGIFVAAVHGFSNYMSPDLRAYIASIYAAFADEFPAHMVTTGETIYLIGAKESGVLAGSVDKLVKGYSGKTGALSRGYEKEIVDNFSPDELRMLFEKSQLEYFRRVIVPLAKDGEANQDLRPGAYWKEIVFTAYRERSALYGLIRGHIVGPVLALLISAAALWNIRRRHGPLPALRGLLMYLTGFVSISAMIILILLYQNYEGNVYYRIALINALFMLGLAIGGFAFTRRRFVGPAAVFAAISFSLFLMLLFVHFESPLFFWPLLLVFSVLCGAVFPLLFAAHQETDYFSPASVLDAMDHFGAIIGAILTVIFLVPSLGIQAALIFNCILILPAAVIARIKLRRQ